MSLGWPSETAAALFLCVPKRGRATVKLAALRALFDGKGLRKVSLWRFR